TVRRVTFQLVKGKRGLILLLLMGLLGAIGAGYRALTGMAQSQLSEAEEQLVLGDGESLTRAYQLFQENLSSADDDQLELAAFTASLLNLDYGAEHEPPTDLTVENSHTAFGGAAVVLNRLASGDVTVARPDLETLLDSHPEDWVSHWTSARVAIAEGDYSRALDALRTARDLDSGAVLPVATALRVSLERADDEAVEELLGQLEALNPEHPSIALGRTLLAFGVDPTRSRAGALDVVLPESEEAILSDYEATMVEYVRARQHLASWELREVDSSLRALNQRDTRSVRVALLNAIVQAGGYQLDQALVSLETARQLTDSNSHAVSIIGGLGAEIMLDLGRPDLALQQINGVTGFGLVAARANIEAGNEGEALRLLGRLMDQPDTQEAAHRMLVDYHLRRGVPDRARMRAEALTSTAGQAYAEARVAADEEHWEEAREAAERGLASAPADRDLLAIWSVAVSSLGQAELAIERIDRAGSRRLLRGQLDQMRLDALRVSGRAPRETLAEYIRSLDSVQPTSVTRRASLAMAYEAIGDSERARQHASAVLEAESNHRQVNALMGRLLHEVGAIEESRQYLRTYLALAPETEPTDWARELLRD
ncbi:MAG: tetratricopeptide repeat protein, partial [Myxococcales bacterium]|nr:tetratricopeptide repeat protein [Myxococcales bacterium]